MNLFTLNNNLLLDEANHLVRVHKFISHLLEFLRSKSFVQQSQVGEETVDLFSIVLVGTCSNELSCFGER